MSPSKVFKMLRNLRRIKRKIRYNKTPLVIISALILVLIASVIIVNPFTKEEKTPINERLQIKYELTKTDIFSLDSFDPEEISVLGIRLRDDVETVLKVLGSPDNTISYPPNIVNYEYSKNIGLDETGLILHLVNSIVRRITIKEPFNQLLVGKTSTTLPKEEVYALLGTPDEVDFVPMAENSARAFKALKYKDKGLEVYLKKDKQFGFALVK